MNQVQVCRDKTSQLSGLSASRRSCLGWHTEWGTFQPASIAFVYQGNLCYTQHRGQTTAEPLRPLLVLIYRVIACNSDLTGLFRQWCLMPSVRISPHHGIPDG